MTDTPVSETLVSLSYTLQVFILANALITLLDDFGSWDDLAVLLNLIFQWLILLPTLLFLHRSLKRWGQFEWYQYLMKIMIIMPLLLTTITLVLFLSEQAGNAILVIVTGVINLLPLLIYYNGTKNSEQVE